MTSVIMKNFYVYIHRKATTGEVFYVGKGVGDRAYIFSTRSDWWKRVVQKHGVIVEIVSDNLQEWYAFELESDLISLYGRKDTGDGPLVNMTDGGEGAVGHSHSEETKHKISIANTGKFRSDETKKKLALLSMGNTNMLGKTLSEETKAKLSLFNTGRKHSDDSKLKMSRASKGRTHTEEAKQKCKKANESRMRSVVRSDGEVFTSTSDAARSVGGHQANISAVALGSRKTAYGYGWEYV
jgi:hypothetical protein